VENNTQKSDFSDKKYSELFNNSINGIAIHKVVYDSDKKPINYLITDVNPKFESILSLKKEEVINRLATEVYKVKIPPFLDDYVKVAETLEPVELSVFFEPMNKHFKISVYSFEKGTFITTFDDITQHIQAIQHFKESEEIYRGILDNLDLGYYEVDLEGKYTFVNKFQASYLGLSKEELVGTNYNIFYDKKEEKRVFEKYNEVYRKNLLKNLIDVETKGPNGIKRTFEASISLKHDSNGKKIGFYGTVYDISERKKLELELEALNKELEQKIQDRTKLLKESEEKFRNIFESIPIGMHFYQLESDGKLRFMGANPAADKILHIDNSQFIDKTIEEAFPPLIDTDIPDRYRKLAEEEGSWKWDQVAYEHGQIRGAYEVTAFHTSKMKMVTSFSDITERKFLEENLKKSEENYRLILENANDLISVFDDKFKFEFINEKIHNKLMGYNKEDLIGKRGLSIIHPDDQELVAQEFKKLVETGEGGAIARIKQKSGKYLWTETKGTPFKDREGKTKLLLITRDISERKQSELKLKESETKFREAYNRAEFYKDLFAHDISNILQHILSAMELSDLLINNPENLKDIKSNLNIIKDQVNRGATLVSNVRKLSQLEEYKKSIKPIEIMTIIKDTIRFIKDSYQEREIDIQVDSVSNEIYIQANDLIQDVIENILINSVNHNNNPKVEIIVRFSREVVEKSHYLKIEFIDNGAGIENTRKETIFQRAYNEDISVSGMGLGLSLVKKIIDSFDGKIWVEDKLKNDYSKGSNFIILLPEER
jgi:PAS domain S-box-containing protein